LILAIIYVYIQRFDVFTILHIMPVIMSPWFCRIHIYRYSYIILAFNPGNARVVRCSMFLSRLSYFAFRHKNIEMYERRASCPRHYFCILSNEIALPGRQKSAFVLYWYILYIYISMHRFLKWPGSFFIMYNRNTIWSYWNCRTRNHCDVGQWETSWRQLSTFGFTSR
jgi:hypothetical protein